MRGATSQWSQWWLMSVIWLLTVCLKFHEFVSVHTLHLLWRHSSHSLHSLAAAGWGWGGRMKVAVNHGCIPVIVQAGREFWVALSMSIPSCSFLGVVASIRTDHIVYLFDHPTYMALYQIYNCAGRMVSAWSGRSSCLWNSTPFEYRCEWQCLFGLSELLSPIIKPLPKYGIYPPSV